MSFDPAFFPDHKLNRLVDVHGVQLRPLDVIQNLEQGRRWDISDETQERCLLEPCKEGADIGFAFIFYSPAGCEGWEPKLAHCKIGRMEIIGNIMDDPYILMCPEYAVRYYGVTQHDIVQEMQVWLERSEQYKTWYGEYLRKSASHQ